MLLLHPRASEVSLRNQHALPVSSTSQLQGYLDFSPCAHQGLLHFTALLSASQFLGSLDTHISATVSPQVHSVKARLIPIFQGSVTYMPKVKK